MVMLALDNATQQRVAVKRIPLAAGFKRNTIIGELLNHSMCSGHPHIIQLQVSLAYPACGIRTSVQWVRTLSAAGASISSIPTVPNVVKFHGYRRCT